MKPELKVKIGIDVLMTVLLPLLMSYQVTGQGIHEWLGIGMLALFLMHNVANRRWYSHLSTGRYTYLRAWRTAVNIAAMIVILCLGYSGIVMSQYVAATFSVRGSMALARRMHMVFSYWGFVLMGIHAGSHWDMILGVSRKLRGGKKISIIWEKLSWAAAALIAGYGAYRFYRADIISYMFLQEQFVFFDLEKSAVSIFAGYAAMMVLWAFVGFYMTKVLRKIGKRGDAR